MSEQEGESQNRNMEVCESMEKCEIGDQKIVEKSDSENYFTKNGTPRL